MAEQTRRIRLACGVSGDWNGKDDDEFDRPADEAARLVAKGLAHYVDPPKTETGDPSGQDEAPGKSGKKPSRDRATRAARETATKVD